MKKVRYPFGFGLSYTEFEYSDITLSAERMKDTDTLTVTCKVKNIGDRDGAEVVQLYVRDCESTVFRPEKELRDFSKVFLKKGEEKTVSFTLSKRAFAYYNINISDWHVESGDFEILIGASSRDIRLSAGVTVESALPDVQSPDYRESAPCYYGADVKNVPDRQYRAVLGRDIPPKYYDVNDKFTMESCLLDAEHTKWGKRIIAVITGVKKPDPNAADDDSERYFVLEIPIRSFCSDGQGIFTEKMAEGLLMLLNEEGSAAALMKLSSGLIPALKFALRHKQLKWLYITATIANIGFIATTNYQVIMSYGYAENFFGKGLFDSLDAALEAVSVGDVTTALFMFPVGCAVSQVIMGFICDSKGRKAAAVTTAFNGLLFFVLFSLGSKIAFNPYIVGFCCGAFIGSYYSTNDVIIMMIGESSPTNLRSSTMSAQFIVTAVGVAVSYIVSLPLITILGNSVTGIVSFALLVPGFIAALICLIRKTNETKGIDMDTVTGCEWD